MYCGGPSLLISSVGSVATRICVSTALAGAAAAAGASGVSWFRTDSLLPAVAISFGTFDAGCHGPRTTSGADTHASPALR